MNQRTFLYQLQLLDLELDKNEKRLMEIREFISNTDDQKKIEQIVSGIESEKKIWQTKLNKISNEAHGIQVKIKSSEKALYDGSIKNPKELQDVNIEIDSLKKRLLVQDEQQLEIMFSIEELENQITVHENTLSVLKKDKSVKTEILLNEVKEIEKSNNKITIEKNPILNQIEDEFLTTYVKLRKSKNKIAVSLVVDNACSMCGNGILPMEVQKARSSIDEVFCSVCKRFLYSG
jgi:predicted  nucleic acid-binding Zn-ribbon protein